MRILAILRKRKMASKTRGKQWSDDATRCLIQLWAEETIQISLDSCKTSRASSVVYNILLSQLKEKGYKDFTLKELINKLKKLRQKYKEEKDKSRQTGTAALKKWKFFDEIDSFLTQRHNVNPPVVVDTMASNELHVQEVGAMASSELHGSEAEHNNLSEVDYMIEQYGAGETSVIKCPTCDYEQEIRSSGVHISEGGSVSVYSEEDEFCCPNCVSKSGKQATKICRDDDDNSGNDDDSSTCEKKVTDAVADKETTSSKKTSNKKKMLTNQEKELKLPMNKKRKSNIEKSLEIVFEKFKESSATEFERYQKLEDDRAKLEHKFRLEQLKMENERRKEERMHELNMLRMILSPQQSSTVTTGYQVFNNPISCSASFNPHPSDSSSHSLNEYPTHDCATYFKL